ncbi:unnamed protein product [Rotaria sp. Silwood2]|nr:unnamed protein product [Rotaria sp. Silwood2]
MPRRKQKSDNVIYCRKYRQKIQLKRLQSRNFDKKLRKKEASRKAVYRAKRKQQETVPSASTTTISRNDLRKIEGLQRRRQNTAKLKLEKDQLQNSNKQLQKGNRKLKEQLASLRLSLSSSSSPQETTTNSAATISPSKLFLSKQSIRNKFGINLSNQNLPSTRTTTISRELADAIDQFLNDDEITRMSQNKDNIVDGKQVRFLLNHLINIHQKFIMETRYECSYSTFTRHIPSYIISPKPSDWGTCLCMTCLNPQLKSERINQLKNVNPLLNYLSSLLTNDLTSIINDEKTVNEILEELHRLKAETFMITYVEWIKRKSEKK